MRTAMRPSIHRPSAIRPSNAVVVVVAVLTLLGKLVEQIEARDIGIPPLLVELPLRVEVQGKLLFKKNRL